MSDLKLITSEPWLDMALIQIERNGAHLRADGVVLQKIYLTQPALSEMPGNLLQTRQRIRVSPYQKNKRSGLRIRFRPSLFPFFQRSFVNA